MFCKYLPHDWAVDWDEDCVEESWDSWLSDSVSLGRRISDMMEDTADQNDYKIETWKRFNLSLLAIIIRLNSDSIYLDKTTTTTTWALAKRKNILK